MIHQLVVYESHQLIRAKKTLCRCELDEKRMKLLGWDRERYSLLIEPCLEEVERTYGVVVALVVPQFELEVVNLLLMSWILYPELWLQHYHASIEGKPVIGVWLDIELRPDAPVEPNSINRRVKPKLGLSPLIDLLQWVVFPQNILLPRGPLY